MFLVASPRKLVFDISFYKSWDMDFPAPFETFLDLSGAVTKTMITPSFSLEGKMINTMLQSFPPRTINPFCSPIRNVPSEATLGLRISRCFVFLFSNLSHLMKESGQWMSRSYFYRLMLNVQTQFLS